MLSCCREAAARGQLAKLFIAHGISNVYFAFNDNKIERLDTSKTFTLSSFWTRLHTNGGGWKKLVYAQIWKMWNVPRNHRACNRRSRVSDFTPWKTRRGGKIYVVRERRQKFFIANLWKIITKYSAFCSSLLHCRLCRFQGSQKSSQKRKLNFSVVHSLNCYTHFSAQRTYTHFTSLRASKMYLFAFHMHSAL